MINVEQKENNLIFSYFDSKGDIALYTKEIPEDEMFNWYVDTYAKKPSTVLSQKGENVKKVNAKKLNRYRIEELIIKYVSKEERKFLFEDFNYPNVWFCDIEVEIKDGFPTAEKASTPITNICLTNKDKIVVMGLKQLSDSYIQKLYTDISEYFKKYNYKPKIKYIFFDSEKDMLDYFFYKAMPKIPLLTGWNFVNYDWLYLCNRASIYNIDISLTSPTQNIYSTKSQKFIVQHRPILDYMELYLKYDRKISDKNESATLDFVSKKAIGIGKIKFEKTLTELYEQDYYKYTLYNVVDTLLVQFVDEYLQSLRTFLFMSYITEIQIDEPLGSVKMTEMQYLREYYKENKIFVKEYTEDAKRGGKKYAGAFVKDITPGFYLWVISIDATSLYPSIMMEWEVSPENFIGKYTDSKHLEILKRNFPNYIITKTNAVFDKTKKSYSRTILEKHFNERQDIKNMMFESEKKLEYLKSLLK